MLVTLRLLGCKESGRLRVGHDDIRIALQRIKIVLGKAVAFLGGDQQPAGLQHQGCGGFRGERFPFGVQRLIHRDDEQGERMQPGEPGIIREQLQEMIGRRNRADLRYRSQWWRH